MLIGIPFGASWTHLSIIGGQFTGLLGSQDAKEGLNLEIYAQVINWFMSGLLQVFTYMDSQL
jgi:hypothetical protein